MSPVLIVGISGSLRAASTNTALLRAAVTARPAGVSMRLYEGLGAVPIFNPDDDPDAMPEVVALRRTVDTADGLVIACPEYARGVPGGLKNALDWLVSGPEFPGKPVALFHASARATAAPAALAEILRTMSADLVTAAFVTIPLLGRDPDATARILGAAETRDALRAALASFVTHIERHGPRAAAAPSER